MSTIIAKCDVFVVSPSRNYVILKITTSDGVVGWGDATLNGRELAVASYLRDHIVPLLIGRDAQQIEDTWQYLYRGVYWRRGPVTMAAIGAVDLALWDIKGKTASLPVYELLGGQVRPRVLAYTHVFGWETPEVLDAVDAILKRGYRAVRVQSGVPGLDSVYGVQRGRPKYEPAVRGGLPTTEVWDSSAYKRHVPTMLESVRAHVGGEVELLHDAHHRLSPIEAAQFAKSVEDVSLFWLEDPTPAENQESLNLVRTHSTTPIAIGEVFNTIWDCKDLITQQSIDYIRTCVMHAGGISHVRRIFDLAAIYGIKAAPHGPSDVSPITMAASVHLALTTPNFGIQEYMGYDQAVWDIFKTSMDYSDGYLSVGAEPGLGVEIDESAIAAWPYSPAYLPVARKRDGAMTDW